MQTMNIFKFPRAPHLKASTGFAMRLFRFTRRSTYAILPKPISNVSWLLGNQEGSPACWVCLTACIGNGRTAQRDGQGIIREKRRYVFCDSDLESPLMKPFFNYQKPMIVLEAVASHDLWLWHAFFGLPGSQNDITILEHSPLFCNLINGTAPSCKYTINGHQYTKGYYLADGIYPEWSTLVKTISQPQGLDKKLSHFISCFIYHNNQ